MVRWLVEELELIPLDVRPELLDDVTVLLRHVTELKVEPANGAGGLIPLERKSEGVAIGEPARDVRVARSPRLVGFERERSSLLQLGRRRQQREHAREGALA